MNLISAIQASPVKAAKRNLTDGTAREGRDPNIVLMDEKTDGFSNPKIKAFRAVEICAWERRPLREAKALTDWWPAANRGVPPIETSG